MKDVLIVGSGPAGISAALYTARANLSTVVVGRLETSALYKAHKIENYYGFAQGISGRQLLDEGVASARHVGAEVLEAEVLGIEQGEHLTVHTSAGTFETRAVILAVGQPVKKLSIEGLARLEGQGVSYCTTCDGFFYRKLKVAVVGNRDYAVHEARELEAFTSQITLLTHGQELVLVHAQEPLPWTVDKRRITAIEGADAVSGVRFEDGTLEPFDGVFIANETASGTDFARKLGLMISHNAIVADAGGLTNIPGIFAAGDCTGGFKQVSVSVGQGALAGRSAIEYVRKLSGKQG